MADLDTGGAAQKASIAFTIDICEILKNGGIVEEG